MIDKTEDVLFEERDGVYFKGHTSNYVVVKVKTEENLENKIIKTKITNIENLDVLGTCECK